MSKVILFIACSADGYIAGPNEEIDWLFTDQDYGYNDFIKQVDVVIMGRKTYDLVLTFGEYPYLDKQNIIFSRNKNLKVPSDYRVVDETFLDTFNDFRESVTGNIWLVGGGEVIKEFLKHNLVDEYVISYHPILLGAGIPLFPAGYPAINLKTVSSKVFNTGLMQVIYQRIDK